MTIVDRARAFGEALVATVRRTVREAIADDLSGEAAKMAYYFFLSLFPSVLVIFALTGIVGGNRAFDSIASTAQTIVPDSAWQFVRELIREITDRRRPGMLSFGIALTYWAASNGIAALTGSLNAIYDVEETRSWIHRRLLSLGILVVAVLAIVFGTSAFIPGLSWIHAAGLGDEWLLLRWPLGFALATGLVWLAFRYLPARDQRTSRRETLVGAIVATSLWVVSTLLFRLYIENISRYSRSYGAVGAVIVLLLWFYLAAFVVLLGGELAAAVESQRRDGDRTP